jgi:hypothetical protein
MFTPNAHGRPQEIWAIYAISTVPSARYNGLLFAVLLVKASEKNSEWLTRKRLIDPKLKAAGWSIIPFSPGMSVPTENTIAVEEA